MIYETPQRQSSGHNTHLGYYTDSGPMCLGQYNGLGEYCGKSTASEVFLIFTTQLYQFFSVFFLFTLFTDEPEVFLPEYSQRAILHAAHFRRVVKLKITILCMPKFIVIPHSR